MPIPPSPRLPLSLHPVPHIINGGGVLIQSGPAGDLHWPWDAELVRIHFFGRPIAGSMTIDILTGPVADYPDSLVSMVGSGIHPSITDEAYTVFEDFDDWDSTHFDAGTMSSLVVTDNENFDFCTVELIVRSL